LIDIEFMDETAFILLWYLYGGPEPLCPRATNWNLIKELNERMFKTMKENYFRYLSEMVLKELLSTNPENTKDVKEELLLQAISLYQRRFRSIWMRIPRKTEKFDDLKEIFLIYQKVIDFGIYYSLKYLFKELNANLESTKNNGFLLYSLKQHFYQLALFLSEDENENWGLRWIANQKDPLLILAYFYYLECPPGRFQTFLLEIKRKRQSPRRFFNFGFYFLKRKLKYQLDVVGDKLIFFPDFQNTFPSHIMQSHELETVITKIISKLLNFCSDYDK
jgi:hypothetical protein